MKHNSLHIFESRSSISVRLVTLGTLIGLVAAGIGFILMNKNHGWLWGLILGAVIFGVAFYFYSNSLDKIIVEEEGIILKKNIGQIVISKSEFVGVEKSGSSNLTMTYGSNGVFGYIGNTMDDSVSLVKDRKLMVKISTASKKYILSTERPDDLIAEIKRHYNL